MGDSRNEIDANLAVWCSVAMGMKNIVYAAGNLISAEAKIALPYTTRMTNRILGKLLATIS